MPRRLLTLLAALVAGGFVEGLTERVHADCVDTPITITFDAGSGTPHCFTESGVTVCASVGQPPTATDSTLILGDNDGDTSPDLANEGDSADVKVYTFSAGGAPFKVVSFDFVNDPMNEPATFTPFKPGGQDCCADFQQQDTGTVTIATASPDPTQWSGITSFTWTTFDVQSGPQVMDNLSIVIQCCGNGTVDSGEQCDDGNALDGDCCSSTCQYEANGNVCTPDANVCTDDVCDGAGTCLHPDLPNCNVSRPCGPARPPGTPAFEAPKKTASLKTCLVQPFISCGDVGGNTPDRTTEGGIPACQPETPNEAAGSPSNGWKWDETRGQASLSLGAACSHADDILVKLKVDGIIDGGDLPATGAGSFSLTWRATVNDPTGGDMTTVDLTSEIPFSLANGDGALLTTVGVMLSESGMPDLPNGSSFELLNAEVRDPNGNAFAKPGLFLMH
jgi:cysteine-rich repeat protein